MKKYESEHYIFNFEEGSKAEQDILIIAAMQEACIEYICKVLDVNPEFKIEYYLCETPEDVGCIYGDNEPCNGFAARPNKIYAVYNEEIQCIGFHEDAHIISYIINIPESTAIREGLAMYFDRKSWGIQNIDWCGYFIETNQYVSVESLLDEDIFDSVDVTISYPIMGAFTEYLISTYGNAKYISMYKQDITAEAVKNVYNKSIGELETEFVEYIKLFSIDEMLKKRMSELLEGN